MIDEIDILERLGNQDIKAFKEICMEFLEPLENFAFSLLNDANKSREVVTDVFSKIWATKGFENASLPLLGFFQEQVRAACLK